MAELLNTDFPAEPAEEAYRRGYNDGLQAALDYIDDGIPIGWLARWRLAILEEWMRQNTETMIFPPLADLYTEVDGRFRLLNDEEAPNAQ